MALGIGLISALIIAKKHSKKTRLQKLQEKLNTKKKKQLTLKQVPIKKLFMLFFITVFFIFLDTLSSMYTEDLLAQQHQSVYQDILWRSTNINERLTKLESLGFVLKCLKVCYFFMTVGILSTLEVKVVKAMRGRREILVHNYSLKFWIRKSHKIAWNEGQEIKLQILETGEQRFTQNTVHYAIRVINQKRKSEEILIERSDIFNARKDMIELASILDFKPNLKIH